MNNKTITATVTVTATITATVTVTANVTATSLHHHLANRAGSCAARLEHDVAAGAAGG